VSEIWPGLTGNDRLVRFGANAADMDRCTEKRAAKARPAVMPAHRSTARKKFLNDFPLGVVMDALDAVEFDELPSERAINGAIEQSKAPLHPGAIRWIWHGVRTYLAVAALVDSPATSPVSRYWVAQQQRGEDAIWEMYAWGRRYESPDGSVRELRLPRFGEANAAPDAEEWDAGAESDDPGAGRRNLEEADQRRMARVAIAAYSAAFGGPATWPSPWSDPFRLPRSPWPAIQRVRVVEVGLAGGQPAVLFDGTPADAKARYDQHARDELKAIRPGGNVQPGQDCADCKLLTACRKVQRVPGILGIIDPTAPLRSWSVSNGRYYRECPAQDHLRRLHLPKDYEYNEAAERGQAIHARLAEQHARQPHRGCIAADLPPVVEWGAGGWQVTGEQASLGRRMLANHVELCSLHRGEEITEVLVEPTIAVHDTDANVIVIAKPDMLYVEDGAWVWHELKTKQGLRWSYRDLLRDIPQLALAVVLMAENALPLATGTLAGGRIELELLAPDAADMLLIDPNDPVQVAAARQVVHELAAPWHGDLVAAAKPGDHCARCPVKRWCPDAPPSLGASLATVHVDRKQAR
jgi:hypothetical protein